MFDQAVQENRIVDIFRTEAVLPVAEAYVDLGMTGAALDLYGRALTEAFHNPNSVPRSEDLVAICVSMATRGVEPTDALMERLAKGLEQLGHPW